MGKKVNGSSIFFVCCCNYMRQAISLYIIGDGLSKTDLIEIVLSRYFVSVSLYPERDGEKRKV